MGVGRWGLGVGRWEFRRVPRLELGLKSACEYSPVSTLPKTNKGKDTAATEAHELELELIQTQMTQKPMLRAEVYARALRASQNRKEDSL